MKKPNFSQAHGLEPVPGPLGLGELPQPARNQIWAVFHIFLKDKVRSDNILPYNFEKIFLRLHVHYFNSPMDEFCSDYFQWHNSIKTLIFEEKYNRVFDFIHEVINDEYCPKLLTKTLAKTFDRTQIAYRILIDEKIIVQRISDEEEVAFDEALKNTSSDKFSGAKTHLKNAAIYLRDNRAADSIPESIHAVESVMKILTGDISGDFSRALNKIAPTINLHPALKRGFDAIYGYTSNENGLRHCLLDEEANVTTDEAIFMLSSCSSIVNYLINKHDTVEGLKTLCQTNKPDARLRGHDNLEKREEKDSAKTL